MKTHAVVEVGGKQYLVQQNDEIIVENLNKAVDEVVEFPSLMTFDQEKTAIELGGPHMKEPVKAQILENLKGDKLRVARFKSKVRYRRVTGFRPQLTKIRIISI
ncbi:50S ribosomal protein L21 [Candidatus Woesebacteria bacterium]|nr:50S ribosomal protein L21 [Candidatus Woesebacteria bacterium]